MKKFLLLPLLILMAWVFNAKADYFLAGEFNDWTAGDPKYKFEAVEGQSYYKLVFPDKIFGGEFKVTSDTWELSWGSYYKAYPGQWIELTTAGYNNISIYGNNRVLDAIIYFDPTTEGLSIEGTMVPPPMGYGLLVNNDIKPLVEMESNPGIYYGKYTFSSPVAFEVAYYDEETNRVEFAYGALTDSQENLIVGTACFLSSSLGHKINLPAGEYEFYFSNGSIVVTDSAHPLENIYMALTSAAGGADYVIFGPSIFNFGLPQGTEYTLYVKINDGEYSPYDLTYAGWGVTYESPYIALKPNTTYHISLYASAEHNGQKLYWSPVTSLSFTTPDPFFNFYFAPENIKSTSTDVRYMIYNNLKMTEVEYEIAYRCIDTEGNAPDVTGIYTTDTPESTFTITGCQPNTIYDLYLDVTMITPYGSYTVKTENPGWFWTAEDDDAVEVVTAEESTPRYFNLNGVEVKNPQNGIFIEVINGKSRKVVK